MEDISPLNRENSAKDRENWADNEDEEQESLINRPRSRLSRGSRSSRANSSSFNDDNESTEDNTHPPNTPKRPKTKKKKRKSRSKIAEIEKILCSTDCEKLAIERLGILASSEDGLMEDEVRRKVWPRLAGIKVTEAEILPNQEECENHPEYNQVVLDVNRSLKRFPPGIAEEVRPELQDQLTRLIVRVLLKHPDLHYYQVKKIEKTRRKRLCRIVCPRFFTFKSFSFSH